MIATQCSTCSRARHRPVGSSRGPIRSNSYLFGLAGIPFKDQEKVRIGSKQMYNIADIIRICIRCKIPRILENPDASMLFLVRPIHRLLSHASCESVITDQCAFGARWRKRTRIACWSCHGAGRLRHISMAFLDFVSFPENKVLAQEESPGPLLPKNIRPSYLMPLLTFLLILLRK